MELQRLLSKKIKWEEGKPSSHLKINLVEWKSYHIFVLTNQLKMKYNNNTPFEEFMYRFAIVFGVTVITLNLIILVSKLIG
jgi:hypothetical protein